ncbi:MAG TPA: hypothetical protein VD772_07275, partial [Anseongella sp.]|nr:hypothetical protein [Anseongella sp.]
IDTELLLTITKALNVDLFKFFYEEEPLKTFRENEIRALNEQIASLKQMLAEKEELMVSQSRYVKSQEDVIRLMKEKENFFKTNPPR